MNEAFVLSRINTQLQHLGWIFDGKGRNVFQNGECPTRELKKRLQGKRHDYLLCKQNSNSPLAIIEAKKPRGNLDYALEQGIKYAEQLGARIVFATDSYVVKMVDTAKHYLTIDGEILRSFVKEDVLSKLFETPYLETDRNVIQNRDELIKLFKKAEKLLRQDGIDAGIDSIYEFCSILFIKIKSEINKSNQYYNWDNLIQKRGNNLYEHYKNTINHFKEKYQGIFRDIKIESPQVLESIVDSLKNKNISNTTVDIKGASYEHFLKRYSAQNKSVLGQHFTPRHIIEMMVVLLDPKIKEKIYDPFCGTGGMLIECYKWIRKNITEKKDIKKLNERSLFGNDISFGTSQLAKMNMVLVGDGHSNIQRQDSLANLINNEYDCLITNIPFNLSNTDKGTYYNITDSNANVVCLHHCIKATKKGGRVCIIIPEHICYSNVYIGVRKFLASNGTINAVIRLPRETFKTYTTARTCILWITKIKESKTSSFTYVEIKNDGYSKGTWREPILKNDIPKILEYRNDLDKNFKTKTLNKNFEFIVNENSLKEYTGDSYLLSELLEIREEKKALIPNKEYKECRLSSSDNTITAKKDGGRLGKNINGKKIIIEPDDLVIATLHTQSGNGLFAISNNYYIATTHIVGQIKTDKISKEYLVLMLKNILPKLSKNDLTGRETYTKEEILSLKIPKQPKDFSPKAYNNLFLKKEKMETEIRDYEKRYYIY